MWSFYIQIIPKGNHWTEAKHLFLRKFWLILCPILSFFVTTLLRIAVMDSPAEHSCRMDQYFGSSCQTSWFFEQNYSTVLQKVIDHSRISITQKVKFLKRFLKKTSELVRFTKEILNRKPYIFSSEDWQSTVTGEFSEACCFFHSSTFSKVKS